MRNALLFVAALALSQAGVTGHAGFVGKSGFFTTSGSIVSATAVPIGDPPLLGTCGTQYQSTTGNVAVTYPLGFYDSGSGTHCTDQVPTVLDTALRNAMTGIKARNAAGSSGSGSGFFILNGCVGMSVVVESCGTLIPAATASGVKNSKFAIVDHAVSNNDADVWVTGTPNTQANACLPSYAQCTSNGLSGGPTYNCSGGVTGATCANNWDKVCNTLQTTSRSCLMEQIMFVNQANGTQHQYANGCYTGTGASSVYYLCNPLDGLHQINNASFDGISAAGGIDATNILYELGQLARAAKSRMPNLAITYFSSREYAGYCPTGCADPEPEAFEKALSIRALIMAQVCEMGGNGCSAGTIDPVAGDLCPDTTAVPLGCGGASVSGSSSVLMWADCEATGTGACEDGVQHSAYFWANGPTPRFDGLAWCHGSITAQPAPCGTAEDFLSPDWLHLSTAGATKDVSGMPATATNGLLGLLRHSPYLAPFFCATNGSSGC